MIKREIKFREHGASGVLTKRPSDAKLRVTNGTVEQKDYLVTLDENGFITSDACKGWERRNKVVLLGNSILECLFIDEGKRISDVMNWASEKNGYDYGFYNGATSSSTTLHILFVILAKIIPFRPSHIIFLTGGYDIECSSNEDGFWNSHVEMAPLRCTPPVDPRWVKTETSYDDWDKLLDVLTYTCDRFGIEVFFATAPICPRSEWSQSHSGYYNHQIGKLRKYNRHIRSYSAARGKKVLDIDAKYSFDWDMYYDAKHFNEKGCAHFADALLSEFMQSVGSMPFSDATSSSVAPPRRQDGDSSAKFGRIFSALSRTLKSRIAP